MGTSPGAVVGLVDPAELRWVEALRKELAAVRHYSLGDFAESSGAGYIAFGHGAGFFEPIARFCREVESLPLERLPAGTLRHLLQPLKALAEALRQIAEFSPIGLPDPDETREHLVRSAQSSYDHFFTAMAPYVAYLHLPPAASRPATDLPQDLRREVRDGLRQLRLKMKELDELADLVRHAAANFGPVPSPKTFVQRTWEHTDKQATESVLGAIVLGLALAAVLLWFVWLATSWGV